MTEADHADLSRRLALAIGHAPEDVSIWKEGTEHLCIVRRPHLGPGWRCFDYRDPAVIWRVAERYDVFPTRLADARWLAVMGETLTFCYGHGSTAAEAVARAVIRGKV